MGPIRKFKVHGKVNNGPAYATITINGQRVFSGILSAEDIIASGEVYMEDHDDDIVDFSIVIDEGNVSVGMVSWNYMVVRNPDVSDSEFSLYMSENCPLSLTHSIYLRGGAYLDSDPNLFGYGNNQNDMNENRFDIKINGKPFAKYAGYHYNLHKGMKMDAKIRVFGRK